MTKVKTYVPSRFGREVSFPFGKVFFDKNGHAEVDIPDDFELEPYRLFPSDHEQIKGEKKIEEGSKRISPEEASALLKQRKEAQKKEEEVKGTEETLKVEEAEKPSEEEIILSLKEELDKSTLQDLKKMAGDMSLPEEEWKKMKKVDLIEYLAPKI